MQWLAGLYVASPVEDYFLLLHVGREQGGLGEGERNLAQLVTSAPPLLAPDRVACTSPNSSQLPALVSCVAHSAMCTLRA